VATTSLVRHAGAIAIVMVALLATAREKAAAQGKPSATKEASQRGEFTTRQRELPPWTPKNSRQLHRFPRRPGGAGWARGETSLEQSASQPVREMPASRVRHSGGRGSGEWCTAARPLRAAATLMIGSSLDGVIVSRLMHLSRWTTHSSFVNAFVSGALRCRR